MWSKAYKSQVVFEDFYWIQASLNRGLLLCARACCPQRRRDPWPDPWPRSGGGGQWRRQRDHWCV